MTKKDLITLKGGSWDFIAGICRSVYRVGWHRDYSSNYVGFRIVLRKRAND